MKKAIGIAMIVLLYVALVVAIAHFGELRETLAGVGLAMLAIAYIAAAAWLIES